MCWGGQVIRTGFERSDFVVKLRPMFNVLLNVRQAAAALFENGSNFILHVGHGVLLGG